MATLPAGYILQRKVPSVIPSADADEMIMPALDLGTQSNMGLGLTPLIGERHDTISPLLHTKTFVLCFKQSKLRFVGVKKFLDSEVKIGEKMS